MIITLIGGYIKSTYYKWANIFLNRNLWEEYGSWIRSIESCYKSIFKKATSVDTSEFTYKGDLASLKSKVGKLDVDKLETAPADLSKLSDVGNNEVVKKNLLDELVKKVNNAIDTSGFVKQQIMMLRSMALKVKYLVLLA